MAKAIVHRVQSESDPHKMYTVTVHESHARCTCPAWEGSHLPPRERVCKHVEKVTGTPRRGSGSLRDYEEVWVIREVVKRTDMKLTDIAEALNEELFENAAYSEYERTLGESIASTFERLWPKEGWRAPGPDARQTLSLIERVLGRKADRG